MTIQKIIKEQESKVLSTVFCFLEEINISDEKEKPSAFALQLLIMSELSKRSKTDKSVAKFLNTFKALLK